MYVCVCVGVRVNTAASRESSLGNDDHSEWPRLANTYREYQPYPVHGKVEFNRELDVCNQGSREHQPGVLVVGAALDGTVF